MAAERIAPLATIKRRADFLAAAKAARANAPAFTLQARARGDEGPARVGFTCSKKVGNAVARNRAKRRLRAAAAAVLPQAGRQGFDYVLIGRPLVTAAHPFEALLVDLAQAVARAHAPRQRDKT